MLIAKKQQKLNPDFKSILKAMVGLFKKTANLEDIYNLEDGLIYTKASFLAIKWLKTQPGVAPIIQERYIAPHPDIEKLLQYPENTLGYAYADYITKSGFDPSFYRQIKVEDDISYVLLRIRQTHDIWHIVTGFSPNVLGEIGLKAFETSQTRRNLAFVLIGIALISFFVKAPESLADLIKQIALGYQMGLKAKPLFAQKWEEHWDQPLSELRTELGIEPISVC